MPDSVFQAHKGELDALVKQMKQANQAFDDQADLREEFGEDAIEELQSIKDVFVEAFMDGLDLKKNGEALKSFMNIDQNLSAVRHFFLATFVSIVQGVTGHLSAQTDTLRKLLGVSEDERDMLRRKEQMDDAEALRRAEEAREREGLVDNPFRDQKETPTKEKDHGGFFAGLFSGSIFQSLVNFVKSGFGKALVILGGIGALMSGGGIFAAFAGLPLLVLGTGLWLTTQRFKELSADRMPSDEAINAIASEFWEGISDSLIWVSGKFRELIRQIPYVRTFEPLFEGVENAANDFLRTLPEILGGVFGLFEGAAQSLIHFDTKPFLNAVEKFVNDSVNLSMRFIGHIATGFSKFSADIWERFIKGTPLGNLLKDIETSIKNMFQGFVNMKNAVTMSIDNTLTAINNFLQDPFKLVTLFNRMTNWVTNTIPTKFKEFTLFATEKLLNITGTFQVAMTSLFSSIDDIRKFFVDVATTIEAFSLGDMLERIKKSVTAGFESIENFFSNLFSNTFLGRLYKKIEGVFDSEAEAAVPEKPVNLMDKILEGADPPVEGITPLEDAFKTLGTDEHGRLEPQSFVPSPIPEILVPSAGVRAQLTPEGDQMIAKRIAALNNRASLLQQKKDNLRDAGLSAVIMNSGGTTTVVNRTSNHYPMRVTALPEGHSTMQWAGNKGSGFLT